MYKSEQAKKIEFGSGFIAALDQSGGSTPKALQLYGVNQDAYNSDVEMYDLIHRMRSRIATSPTFTGENIIGAILFEMTMDRNINGKPSASYLWQERGIVPFLKIDKGLEVEKNGVQLMKPITDLSQILHRANNAGIFGTKMRSVINAANPIGIAENVRQQFEFAKEILAHDLMPIIEPEVTISIADKADAEDILLTEITKQLNDLPNNQKIMLKISLPCQSNHYSSLVKHPKIMRVVALSGGYPRDEALKLLSKNKGVIASFSRAMTQDLREDQSDKKFNDILSNTIGNISTASA